MNYAAALSELKSGLRYSVYLLHGEETYLARLLEKEIVAAILPADEREMNLIEFDRDPARPELVNLIETVPFMGGKNLIIVRDTQLFRSGHKSDDSDARLEGLLASMPAYSHVLFTTTETVDKRRRLYKTVERAGAVVDIGPLKVRDVRAWINERLAELGKKMAPDALEHFLAGISLMPKVSLGFLAGELEKAGLYAQGPVITRQDLQAVLSSLPEISVFTMIDAVSQKQAGTALRLLRQELAAGESPLRLLALLVRQIRLLWQGKELVACGLRAPEIAERLGVMPFIGEKIVRQSRGFRSQVLERAMLAVAAADRDLKLGRTDAFALEKIIIEMCRQA